MSFSIGMTDQKGADNFQADVITRSFVTVGGQEPRYALGLEPYFYASSKIDLENRTKNLYCHQILQTIGLIGVETMKKLLIGFSLIAVCIGCTKGDSASGGNSPSRFESSDRPVIFLEDVPPSKPADVLRADFSAILNSCEPDFKTDPTKYLRVGSKLTMREDNFFVDGYKVLKDFGATVTTETVQRIVSSNLYITIRQEDHGDYSILSRNQVEIHSDWSSSQLIEVISTNPPWLQNQMTNFKQQEENTYSNCRGDILGEFTPDLYKEVQVTLVDGRKILGILKQQTTNEKNLICRQYNKLDKTVIAESSIAKFGILESTQIISRDFSNPFTICGIQHQILEMREHFGAERSSDGKLAPIGNPVEMHKTEYLQMQQ